MPPKLNSSVPFRYDLPIGNGIYSADVPLAIPEGYLQDATDLDFLHQGVVGTDKGWTPHSTLPSACLGLFYCTGRKRRTRLIAACANGNLYVYESSAWSLVDGSSGRLSTTEKASFTQINDFVFIQSGGNAIVYDPEENKVSEFSVVNPKNIIEVDFFEDDTFAWTGTGVTRTEDHNPEEPYDYPPRYALNVELSGAGTATATRSLSTAKNLSQYDNGLAVNGTDAFVIFLKADAPAYVSNIEIRFYSDTVTPKYASVNLSSGMLNEIWQSVGTWSKLMVPINSFGDEGGVDWSQIVEYRILVTTTAACNVKIDSMHIKIAPPIVVPRRIPIGLLADQNEVWIMGTNAMNPKDPFTTKEGKGIRLMATSSNAYAYLDFSPAKDLTVWPNSSIPSGNEDEIVLYVYRSATGQPTTFRLTFYSGANSWYRDLISEIPNNDGAEVELRISKASTNWTGTTYWNSVTQVRIEATGSDPANYLVISAIRVEPGASTKSLIPVTSADSWTISPSGSGGLNTTDASFFPSTDWTASLRLSTTKKGQTSGTITAALDLSVWTSGESIDNNDVVSCWIYHTQLKAIDKIRLTFTVSSSQYFYYDIMPEQLGKVEHIFSKKKKKEGTSIKYRVNKTSTYVAIPRGRFTNVGGASWASIASFTITLFGNKKAATIYFADLHIRRMGGDTQGLYSWKYRYTNGSVASAASEASVYLRNGRYVEGQIAVDGTAYLVGVNPPPSSANAQLTTVEVYRATQFSPEYRLELSMAASAIQNGTVIVCDIPDADLGVALTEEESGESPLPQGTPRGDKGTLVAGQYWVWGEPSHRNAIYRSAEMLPWIFADDTTVWFPGDVLDVQVLQGYAMIFCSDGIKRLGDSGIEDLQFEELPVGKWAATKIEGGIIVFIASGGRLVQFDGALTKRLTTLADGYLDPEDYYIDRTRLFYYGKDLFISVQKRSDNSWVCLRYDTEREQLTRVSLALEHFAVRIDSEGSTTPDGNSLHTIYAAAGTALYVRSGVNRQFSLKTKDLHFGSVDMKIITGISAVITASNTVTMKLYLDGVLANTQAFNVSGTQRILWQKRWPPSRWAVLEIIGAAEDAVTLHAASIAGLVIPRDMQAVRS